MLKSAEQYRKIFIENSVKEELSIIDKLLVEAVSNGEPSIRVEKLTDMAIMKIKEQGLFVGEFKSSSESFYVISIYELEGTANTEEKEEHAGVIKDIEEFMKYFTGRLKDSAINKVNNVKDSVKLADGSLVIDLSCLTGRGETVEAEVIHNIVPLITCLRVEGYPADFIHNYITQLGYDVPMEVIKDIIKECNL